MKKVTKENGVLHTELMRIADALEAQNTKLDILVEVFGVIITQLLFKKISFASAEEDEEQKSSPPPSSSHPLSSQHTAQTSVAALGVSLDPGLVVPHQERPPKLPDKVNHIIR